MKRSWPVGALALLALAGCPSKPSDETPGAKPVRVTAIPDENPTELVRKFQPMADYLEQKLGTEVKYVPVTDYGAAVQALAADQVDFAWLGGFTFVQAKVLAGGIPLVMRTIDREFKSVFISGADSGVTKLEDLKGKSFAFGSKSSTSGHLMPRHFLTTVAKIDPDKDFDGLPLFSGAHDATAKLVESGKVAAGVLNIEVWERMVEEKKVDTEKVKVFWTTPPYVDYVWAARGGVPEEQREKFRQAFLELDASKPEHRAVLELQGATKFVAASPKDFEAVEAIARSTGLLK
jgi:phosphonate transport system substrate-binding protein